VDSLTTHSNPERILMQSDSRTIETTIHGRYVVSAKAAGLPLVVGFHGYGESAEDEYARLISLNGSDRWAVLAIQGLHRFYRRRTNEVVASWMTKEDREHAIADNLRYVSKVIGSVSQEFSTTKTLAVSGFSQGASMAYRCAACIDTRVHGVIALGGDVPPELDSAALGRISAALIGRGARDDWYTEEKIKADEQRLRDAGVNVQVVTIDAGHEWTLEFESAASRFLESI
jgi:predicted esterase